MPYNFTAEAHTSRGKKGWGFTWCPCSVWYLTHSSASSYEDFACVKWENANRQVLIFISCLRVEEAVIGVEDIKRVV